MPHPSPNELAAFGLGKLPAPMSDTLVAHLETCVECRQAVASISADSFVDRIQAAEAREANGSMTGDARPNSTDVPPELSAHADYRIVRELGRGGMGVVYLARNTILDRDEVLKVAHPSMLAKPGAAERFLQEIRSAAQLVHVNVVRAHTALRLGNLLVFAMEYVPGDDLGRIVRSRGALPVLHACHYAAQVALGLQHAHEKRMVHRDIKPSNLILTLDGNRQVVKILDFGLAKITSEAGFAKNLTESNKMMGTPDYIAPEQILDAASADIRADIYSLGCTLYFLLAETPPFQGGSLYQVLHAHNTVVARPLNLVRPDVPVELARIVARMMAKDPAQRHQTPDEVARDLRSFAKAGAPRLPTGELSRTTPPEVRLPAQSWAASAPSAPPAAPTRTPMPAAPFDFAATTGAARSPRKSVDSSGNRLARFLNRRLAIGLAIAIGLAGIATLAFSGLRIQTPDGTIVIDNLPPDADVRIDGNQVTVRTSENGAPVEIRNPPGTHKLEIRAAGFRVFAKEIELAAGGHLPIHLQFLEKETPRAKKEPDVPAAANIAKIDLPKIDAPKIDAPKADLPKIDTPKVDAPKVDVPKVDVPKSDSPKVDVAKIDPTPKKPPAPPRLEVRGPQFDLRGHGDIVWGVAFSPDGKRLASGGKDGTMRIWDLVTESEIRKLPATSETWRCVAWSPDGKLIAAGGNADVALWDADTGNSVGRLRGHKAQVRGLAFRADSEGLATSSCDSNIKLWDIPNRSALKTLTGHTGFASAVDLSRSGKRLVSGGWDQTLKVWDTSSDAVKHDLRNQPGVCQGISISPDEKTFASSSSAGRVRIWDLEAGQLKFDLKFPRGPARVWQIAYSPDGTMLAVGADRHLGIWNPTTGRLIKELTPMPRSGVLSLAWSADGRYLAAGSGDVDNLQDGSIGIWTIEPAAKGKQ